MALELEFVKFTRPLFQTFSLSLHLLILPLFACPSPRACARVRLYVCRILVRLVLRAASSTLGLSTAVSSAGSASLPPPLRQLRQVEGSEVSCRAELIQGLPVRCYGTKYEMQ